MTRKIIHYDKDDGGRLHCDVCDHTLTEPLPWSEKLIGYPCPECGADMLTLRDFRTAEKMFALFDGVNRWLGWLGSKAPPDNGKALRIKVHNGIHVREQEPGDEFLTKN